MIGVDTNVILRHVLRDDAEQTPRATAFLNTLTRDRPGFVTHVVLAEIDWVLKRGYKISREARLSVIRGLVATRELEFEDGESVVRALAMAEDGADFADSLIAASAELFGVREVATFDRRAAQRLGWQLLEPAAPEPRQRPDADAAVHSGHSPNTSTTWFGSVKPCSAAT